MSPLAVNPNIFDEIDRFWDFVDDLINDNNEDPEFLIFRETLKNTDVFSLSFMNDTEITNYNLSINQNLLIKFLTKMKEPQYNSIVLRHIESIRILYNSFFEKNHVMNTCFIRGFLLATMISCILPMITNKFSLIYAWKNS